MADQSHHFGREAWARLEPQLDGATVHNPLTPGGSYLAPILRWLAPSPAAEPMKKIKKIAVSLS